MKLRILGIEIEKPPREERPRWVRYYTDKKLPKEVKI